MGSIIDEVKKTNVANALKKLQAGKTLTPAEQQIIEDYEEQKQPKKTAGWTIGMFAAEIGVNFTTLKKRLTANGLELTKNQKFPLTTLVYAYFGDLEQERILKTRAEREIAELDLAKRRNELVEVSEIQPVLDEWQSRVKMVIQQLKDPSEREAMTKVVKSPI